MGFRKGKMVEIDGDASRPAVVSADTARGNHKTLVRLFSNLEDCFFVANQDIQKFDPRRNYRHDGIVGLNENKLKSMGVWDLLH